MTSDLYASQIVSGVLADAAHANWAPNRAPTGPEAQLFSAVIRQAVLDVQEGTPDQAGMALAWLESLCDSKQSFRWYCDQLDVSPDRVLAVIRGRIHKGDEDGD